MVHLPRQTPTGEAENDEHQRDCREHSRDAAELPLEPVDRRRQDEGEQHGECDWHEHGLRPIEDDNDQHATREYHPPFQGVRCVIHEAPRGNCILRRLPGLFTLAHPGLTRWRTLRSLERTRWHGLFVRLATSASSGPPRVLGCMHGRWR